MRPIPRDTSFDSTLALLMDPYGFVGKRCRRYRSDIFRTRIMLRQTVCMAGPAAAQIFYDPKRFVRCGAAPEPLRATLFGKGGVQTLDGEDHRQRKSMFMSLMTPDRIAELGRLTRDQWSINARMGSGKPDVVLYKEVQQILTRSVCAWAGVPLPERDVTRRRRQLSALFDQAGSVGAGHVWSRIARKLTERWIAGLVQQVRSGTLHPADNTALQVIALHRQLDGRLLPPRIAAVEVLNVLRPTIANAVFIVFAAHALHRHPECAARINSGEQGYRELFIQEVRRFYPFFPAVIARAHHEFEWEGYEFRKGERVMLSLHDTNHDARTWAAPDQFRPERFRTWDRSPFNFVPQGGGDYWLNHRCPGEAISVEVMKVAVDFLACRLAFEVPEQRLDIDTSRLPALPRDGFIIRNVRLMAP
jgi:fatty-acid peroxygenase